MKTSLLICAGLLSASPHFAHAALYDRGNGMIYDSALDITWLQDANFAGTSGLGFNGAMTWYQAIAWTDGLVYGGFSDWRLPSGKLIGSNDNDPNNNYFDGSTDFGWNNTRSELGHLFFELGNKARYDTAGNPQSGYGLTSSTFVDAGTGLVVAFLNIRNSGYWELETFAPQPQEAWMFTMAEGRHQGSVTKTSNIFAWAVRDGDVAAVPVPAAAWLLGSGLAGLGCLARRKKAA